MEDIDEGSAYEVDLCGEAITLQQPYCLSFRDQDLGAQRYITNGNLISCSVWLGLLMSSDMPFAFHTALLIYLFSHCIS